MDDSDHNEVSVVIVVIDNANSKEGDSEHEENVHYTPKRKMFYYPYQNRFITQLYSINLSVYRFTNLFNISHF